MKKNTEVNTKNPKTGKKNTLRNCIRNQEIVKKKGKKKTEFNPQKTSLAPSY